MYDPQGAMLRISTYCAQRARKFAMESDGDSSPDAVRERAAAIGIQCALINRAVANGARSAELMAHLSALSESGAQIPREMYDEAVDAFLAANGL